MIKITIAEPVLNEHWKYQIANWLKSFFFIIFFFLFLLLSKWVWFSWRCKILEVFQGIDARTISIDQAQGMSNTLPSKAAAEYSETH